MNRLEPGQLWVMRIHAAIFAGVALAAGLAAGFGFHEGFGTPVWLPAAVVLVLLSYPLLIAPGRHWRAWGYEKGDRELAVAHGVLRQVHTVVPYGRVQHIDVAQGPIERSFGVTRLVLHTAGTAHSQVVLPGLRRETAEALRDEIREYIRQEPA